MGDNLVHWVAPKPTAAQSSPMDVLSKKTRCLLITTLLRMDVDLNGYTQQSTGWEMAILCFIAIVYTVGKRLQISNK